MTIHVWGSSESPKVVRNFAEKMDLPYTILLDGKRVFAEAYQGTGIPHTYLIGRDGRVRWSHAGWTGGDRPELERRVQAALTQ